MDASCCPSGLHLPLHRLKQPRYNEKVNRLCGDWRARISGWLLPTILLSCLPSIAQVSNGDSYPLIRGSIVNQQGQPIANVTVQIRDLRGIQRGSSLTDNGGTFAIRTAAEPGDYIVLAAKELQTMNERITLGEHDREIKIALSAVSVTVAPEPSRYTVSAARLSISTKAAKRLESAHNRFTKKDYAGAIEDIDRALEVDPNCAGAFTMRSYIKLATKDFDGAIEDATRSTQLDSHNPESYVALATAYNSMREFQKAAVAAQHALSLRPDVWQGRLELAKSWYGQGQFVVAITVLDLLNVDFPDVHLVRADVLMRLGRREEAVEQFCLFLQQAPTDPRGGEIRQIVAASRKAPVDGNRPQM